MGCTTSKEALRDRRPSPYHRTYSAPVRRRTTHVVSLTSTTIGYLKLDRSEPGDEETMKSVNDRSETKAWSEMIERRIPKTPVPEEPETINAWELMAGLDDLSPLRPGAISRSFSFTTPKNPNSPLPSIVSDFDPDVVSTFQKALDELSPKHQLLLGDSVKKESEAPEFTGIVKARVTEFQRRINSRRNSISSTGEGAKVGRCLKGGEGKVVFYFTSLRGIRKTYEDCWMTRVILKGYGVKIDVRFVPCETCSGSCKVYVEDVEDEDNNDDNDEEEEEGGGGFRRCEDCNENGLVRCSICY